MKKLLLLVVLATACLAVMAAPAYADYFSDMQPGNAYVHPWGGVEPDLAFWEEVVLNPETNELDWFTRFDTPIPPGYTVWFAGWMNGWPRLQVALWPVTTRLDCVLKNPDGSKRWCITAKQAKQYWGKAFEGWPTETIYQMETMCWVVAWTYRLGKLPPGTYTGTGTWTFLAPYLNFELPYGSQKKPDVIPASEWNAANPYTYHFTVLGE